MIQIRDVPDEVHRTLKVRAAAEGLSLSDYIKRDLEELAQQATIEDVFASARAQRELRHHHRGNRRRHRQRPAAS